ncbi:hypothetical protein [Acinetobacter dispersus]|uniref:hypothetical protein n=1 Tax=Acinetobacter dispersus TaxID=70348 RepID=UPI001F4A88E5|nr:hypothetical protein [Acinetobacter dispersus]MCH7390367.1 hypothetical protein [Acinetobacter dispersus]
MDSREVDLTLENVLNTLFQVVAVYACENMKVQKKYPEVYLWFLRRNTIVEDEIRNFLRVKRPELFDKNSNEYIGLQKNLEKSEDYAVYKLSQYYWDLFQYHDVSYIDNYLEIINISKDDLMKFLKPLARQFAKRLGISDFTDVDEFNKKYVFSAFLQKERLIKTLFKYFQIIYELKYNEIKLSPTSPGVKFIELIDNIPYYSIVSRSSIATSNTYLTELGKKRYATLHTPFNFQQGALVDNIIHFIFQHLCDLFKFDKLKGEKSNFDIWLPHKAAFGAVSAGTSSGKRSNADRDEHYSRLNECVNIIKGLLHGLPVEQCQIFESCQNTASMEALLISIIYAYFIDQYDREHLDKNLKSSPSEMYGKPLMHNSKKLKAFFNYLGKEFEDIGFDPEVKIESNADKCTLTLKAGGKILTNLSNKDMDGNNIRSRFKNHKFFFNYE